VTTLFALDTHRLVNDLKSRGYSEQQAAGFAEALASLNVSEHVATKADLREMENRMLRWMIPLMLGQAAVFSLIVKWLVE